MPWARYVADVAGEIDPATGHLWYREINITVPRQSGKSVLILVKNVHRGTATDLFGPRQRMLYTAQTRNDAREKWEDEFVATLKASSHFRNRIRVSYANGRERITFQNGSTLGIDAATESSGHGPTLDSGDIDEGFSRTDSRGEAAMRPAMITRRSPQLWVASTAGWSGQSPYLWPKVETGRLLVQDWDPSSRRAYFEWSLPDDADPGDQALWWTCMPALGHTIDVSAIEAEYDTLLRAGNLAEFRRAYCNQWVDQFAPDQAIIDLARWNALVDLDTGPLEPLAFGVHVTPDRSATMIGVCGRRTDGLAQIELIAHEPGTDWAGPWLVERVPRWRPCAVVLDGTALALEAVLADEDVLVVPTNSTTRAQATVDLYDAVIPSPESGVRATVRHAGDPALLTAVKESRKRVIGQRWVWDGPAAGPLAAVTLAHHGMITYGKPTPPPASPLLVSDDMVTGSEIDLSTVRF